MFVACTRCFKFRILAGTFFPTYVADDLAALVLGLGCQTKWFGLSYDMKHVLYHVYYFVHDLSAGNKNSHTCVNLSIYSEYVFFI